MTPVGKIKITAALSARRQSSIYRQSLVEVRQAALDQLGSPPLEHSAAETKPSANSPSRTLDQMRLIMR